MGFPSVIWRRDVAVAEPARASNRNSSHYPRCRITYCDVSVLAAQLLQSLTWVRGKELSDRVRLTIESGMTVFLADPHSLW